MDAAFACIFPGLYALMRNRIDGAEVMRPRGSDVVAQATCNTCGDFKFGPPPRGSAYRVDIEQLLGLARQPEEALA